MFLSCEVGTETFFESPCGRSALGAMKNMLISILRKFGVGLGHSKNRYSGSDFIMGTLPTVFFSFS